MGNVDEGDPGYRVRKKSALYTIRFPAIDIITLPIVPSLAVQVYYTQKQHVRVVLVFVFSSWSLLRYCFLIE